AAAFSAWLLASSAVNGATALVAAGKLLLYGSLALGVVLFVRRRVQLWITVALVAAFALAAAAWGGLAFFGLVDTAFTGRRQDSFTGQHELALLSTMTLAAVLATLYARSPRVPRAALVAAGVVAVVGVVLGGAIASLLGVYAATGAIVAVALSRRSATARALAVTAAAVLAVTLGTLALRSGDLVAFTRFLGLAERSERQEENVAGWNERLVYVYVGGRIFLDQPLLGTGWHGELPPEEYVRYLPDARKRFPEVPASYLPPRTGFVPQQTYDQVLYELGVVGGVLFLALGVITIRSTLRVAGTWPRRDQDEAAAYVPLAWTAALACALIGAALFGGSALPAAFWLVLGLAAAAPSLVPQGRPTEPITSAS
ncbi:MAG TPA: O-antigen ligase family protein, partial [Gaiellaceae bacterium]|nr:O-antigen ligase family protein [Gaiellaceae bacterium]